MFFFVFSQKFDVTSLYFRFNLNAIDFFDGKRLSGTPFYQNE